MIEGSFTVTFEAPYWVGIFERIDEQGYAVAKIIFGAEPNAETVRLAVLREYRGLRFSAPVLTRSEPEHEVNYNAASARCSAWSQSKAALPPKFPRPWPKNASAARRNKSSAQRPSAKPRKRISFRCIRSARRPGRKGININLEEGHNPTGEDCLPSYMG